MVGVRRCPNSVSGRAGDRKEGGSEEEEGEKKIMVDGIRT